MRRAALLAALGVALLPAAARADHSFVLPSNTLYAGDGNTATFDAAGSDHVFFFDHRPLQLESIKVWRPDGTAGEPINALRGRFRSVFDVRLDQAGTWKIASQQVMVGGTFKLNGEERRVGGRGGPPPGAPRPEGNAGGPPPGVAATQAGAPRGDAEPRRQPPVALQDMPANATDIHLVENVSRAETFVSVGAPTTNVFKPVGKGLEMEPVTHPNALAAGEVARFRFLVDGRPAPGLAVTVIRGGDRYRDEAGEMTLTTGSDGIVAVKWPVAGMYWLGAQAEDAHPDEARAEKRRMSYSATLEVMTP